MLFRGKANSSFPIPIGIHVNVKYFILIRPLFVFTGGRFVTYPTMVVPIKVISFVNNLAGTKLGVGGKWLPRIAIENIRQ